jgi:phosphoserine phosphatase
MPKKLSKIFKTISISLFLLPLFNPVVKAASANIKLAEGNWNPTTRERLEKLLTRNANKGKKVIFDFDNTTVSRDIGDATFAWLVKEKKIDPGKIKALSPDFFIKGSEVSLDKVVDLTEYYEKIQEAVSYDQSDPAGPFNGYAWVVQVMEGKTPLEVIDASKNAFMDNIASKDRETGKQTKIEVTPGKTSYRVPFYHPETVDLIGKLLLNGYDVYIVSASNVWTVRYMITVELAKLLKKEFGKNLGIKPENVFGLNTLLKDKRDGQLYKDFYLVKNNKNYAALQPEELNNYQLTNLMANPLTGFEGKSSTIEKYITEPEEKAFLVCGDSAGDFSMLGRAQNRLWFSRLESLDYQKKLQILTKKSEAEHWFIQPVLYKKSPGLVKNEAQLKTLLRDPVDFTNAMDSIKVWTYSSFLKDF